MSVIFLTSVGNIAIKIAPLLSPLNFTQNVYNHSKVCLTTLREPKCCLAKTDSDTSGYYQLTKVVGCPR